jgi:hypothetical protein
VHVCSGGQERNGGDCQWSLVSDIWNGVGGDAGYAGCMTAVPALGLLKGKPNLNSKCALSVEHIVLRGGGENQSLHWGPGSLASCAALTTTAAAAAAAGGPKIPAPRLAEEEEERISIQ